MRKLWQFFGTVVFFCAWPAFWIYHRVVPGRTRVVLIDGGRVLVMKQWISDGRWGLPGGGLHKGEDIAEGAVREVFEETGVRLVPSQLQPFGKAIGHQRRQAFEFHMFAAEVSSPKTRVQWYEVAELAWIRPKDLNEANSSPDTLHTLQVIRQRTSLL